MVVTAIFSILMLSLLLQTKSHEQTAYHQHEKQKQSYQATLAEHYILNGLPAPCQKHLSRFILSANNFTTCMLNNSVPFHSCFLCADAYRRFVGAERRLRLDETRDDRLNITCLEALRQSKVSLVEIQNATIVSHWRRISCENCFDRDDNGTDVILKLQDGFVEFQRLYQNFSTCRSNSYQDENGDICQNCSTVYHKLVRFYRDAYVNRNKKDFSYLFCLDIQDAFNASTKEWNVVNKCNHWNKDVFASVAFSLFFLFLPVVFYVGVWLQTKHEAKYEIISDATDFKWRSEESEAFPPCVSEWRRASGGRTHLEATRVAGVRGHASNLHAVEGHLPSIGSASISSGSPTLRRSPVSTLSSTNNLLI